MDLLQTVRKEGSRGGRSEFSWSDVQGDAQRENYLGHSLMAPVGRWQKGRDLNWYAKGDNPAGEEAEKSAADKRKEEIRKVKEREEDEMRKALGLEPIERGDTNANMMPLGPGRDDKEVQKILREVARPDEEDEAAVKGLGHGSAAHAGDDTKEVMKGRDDRRSGGLDRRRRSRSREHRHRRRDDEDRPRRRRSRSRDRSRDREREHRRHRSRSREYKHRSRRDSRDRDSRPRREERRERSRDGERRRHRSRSPDDRRDRDRERRQRYD